MGKSFKRQSLFLLLSFLVVSMLGCANSFAPVNNQIPFEDEKSGSGEYKVGSLILDYDYRTIGNTMQFKGVLSSMWTYNSVIVRLYFYDQNSALLKQEIVYFSSARRSYRSGVAFSRSIDVPAGAVGIAFKVVGHKWFDNDDD